MTEFITNLISISKDVFTGSIGFVIFLLLAWGFITISGKVADAILNYIDRS